MECRFVLLKIIVDHLARQIFKGMPFQQSFQGQVLLMGNGGPRPIDQEARFLQEICQSRQGRLAVVLL